MHNSNLPPSVTVCLTDPPSTRQSNNVRLPLDLLFRAGKVFASQLFLQGRRFGVGVAKQHTRRLRIRGGAKVVDVNGT